MSHKLDAAATATAMQDHSEHKPSHAALDAHGGHEPSGHGNRGRHGAGTSKHARHHVEMSRLRFWWRLLLTAPVILTSRRGRHHGTASTPGLPGSLDWGDSTFALVGFRGAVERLSSALGRVAAAEPTWTGDGQGGSARWIPRPRCTPEAPSH